MRPFSVWIFMQLVQEIRTKVPVSPAIIGGRNAGSERYRFVAVLYKNGISGNCGGSLITQRHVLTAKHCVNKNKWDKYEVVLGMYDKDWYSASEQQISVSAIIKHESIDAAILVLARNVTLSENVTTVELAVEQEAVGSWVTAMGWGRTKHSTDGSQARFLQAVDLPIANSSVCNQPPHDMHVAAHEICCGDPTLGEYRGTCHGDSGSPLVYPANSTDDAEVVQIAITARGVPQCPRESVYGVYVSVPAIYNWLVCHTESLDGRNFTYSPHVNCSIYEVPAMTTSKPIVERTSAKLVHTYRTSQTEATGTSSVQCSSTPIPTVADSSGLWWKLLLIVLSVFLLVVGIVVTVSSCKRPLLSEKRASRQNIVAPVQIGHP